MSATERAPADALVARPPLRSLVEELHERRARALLGGGEEKIARQHAADKLTARERLALLIDEGTFTELGIHGRPHFSQPAMADRDAPADGVITETRPTVIRALEMADGKRVERPWRKHGVMPV